MHFGRVVLAFLAGVWLYQAVVLNVGGMLTAIAVPTSYFSWFGVEHKPLALALLQFVGFGLPVAVLIAGGVLSAVRLVGGTRASVLRFLFLGLLVAFVYTVVLTALYAGTLGGDWPSIMAQFVFPSWWALPAAIGPWIGFAFAARISRPRVTA